MDDKFDIIPLATTNGVLISEFHGSTATEQQERLFPIHSFGEISSPFSQCCFAFAAAICLRLNSNTAFSDDPQSFGFINMSTHCDGMDLAGRYIGGHMRDSVPGDMLPTGIHRSRGGRPARPPCLL
jgi:hypothetical protein